jgi:bifunctional UDP-N-acetylglucosamine pyrophosphorylase/glucosamine-1-phosphate N-acetyltransferase
MTDSLADKTNTETTGALEHFRAQIEYRITECARLAAAGVEIVDPGTTYITPGVEIGAGTVIEPNTTIHGATRIGANCRIGPNSVLSNAHIGNCCVIFASVIEGSTIEDDVHVGPFCHVRGGSHLEAGVRLGTSAEVNRSRLGKGTKSNHFSYIGDAEVGADVNIGAGTVTCNYDGTAKHKTIIEDGAFIGSDSMLVAPLRIGKGASTGAGSVVTKDVNPGETVVGVPAKKLKDKKTDV